MTLIHASSYQKASNLGVYDVDGSHFDSHAFLFKSWFRVREDIIGFLNSSDQLLDLFELTNTSLPAFHFALSVDDELVIALGWHILMFVCMQMRNWLSLLSLAGFGVVVTLGPLGLGLWLTFRQIKHHSSTQ